MSSSGAHYEVGTKAGGEPKRSSRLARGHAWAVMGERAHVEGGEVAEGGGLDRGDGEHGLSGLLLFWMLMQGAFLGLCRPEHYLSRKVREGTSKTTVCPSRARSATVDCDLDGEMEAEVRHHRIAVQCSVESREWLSCSTNGGLV